MQLEYFLFLVPHLAGLRETLTGTKEMTMAHSSMINLKLTSWHLDAAEVTLDYFTTLASPCFVSTICISSLSIQM